MTEATVPMWAFSGLLALLQLFVGMLVARLWRAVDENTQAVSKLRELLPSTYATKEELLRAEEYAHEQSHELANHLQGVVNRVTILESRA